MKPSMRFVAHQENNQPVIKPHPLCFRARALSHYLNRDINSKDTFYIGQLGFEMTGITTPSHERGKLEVPEILFIASFAPDNNAIPAILKPNCPEAVALHKLKGEYMTPAHLPVLYDMGYGKVFVKGDSQRVGRSLKSLKIEYESLKGGVMLILNKPIDDKYINGDTNT